MSDFLGTLYAWISFVPKITKTNVLEIVILAFVIYEIMVWIKNTRACDGMDLKIIYNLVDSGKDGADRYDSYRDHIPAGIAKSTGAAGKQEPDFRYFFL